VDQGTLTFECPDYNLNETVNWNQNLALGQQWGLQSEFSIMSGNLGLNKRNAKLVSYTGSFDVNCKVCGLNHVAPQDTDGRPGYFQATVAWGPNMFDSVINETGIEGYAVYFVDDCHKKVGTRLTYSLKHVVPVDQGMRITGPCDMACHRWSYDAPISGAWPNVSGALRFMVVPVLDGGYELPIGTTSAEFLDSTTTTTRAPSQINGELNIDFQDCGQAGGARGSPDFIKGTTEGLCQLSTAQQKGGYCEGWAQCTNTCSGGGCSGPAQTMSTNSRRLQQHPGVETNDSSETIDDLERELQAAPNLPGLVFGYRIFVPWTSTGNSNPNLAAAVAALNSPTAVATLTAYIAANVNTTGLQFTVAGLNILNVTGAGLTILTPAPAPCNTLSGSQSDDDAPTVVIVVVVVILAIIGMIACACYWFFGRKKEEEEGSDETERV